MKTRAILFAFLTALLLLTGCTMPTDSPPKMKPTSGEMNYDEPFLRVHYIDAGQADATLLQIGEDGEIINMLIDAGDWSKSDVVQYLEDQNIQSIDLVVATHAHADHIGQLAKIVETFDVGEVWMNGETANSQVFLNTLNAIEKQRVDYYEPQKGETFDIGPLTVDVLHPTTIGTNVNNNSISMMLTYGDVKLLFTGDAEKQAEKEMLDSGQSLQAHIFQMGHHGSKTSNSEAFLQAVQPEVAIYSAGLNNSYGIPDQEVLDRVKNMGIPVYGTAVDGTVLVETTGKSYQVMTAKNDILPPPLLAKHCINLNEATAEELQKITHIGEKLASEIIQNRPFKQVEDLLTVKGIGQSRLNDIMEQDLICTGG